jgi:hypothetical protein
MLGPINAQAAKNKVETDHEKAIAHLHAFIKQQRVDPEELSDHTIQKVSRDFESMTILTESGHYLHVSAERGYGDSIDFSVTGHPDIEDAYQMGILSQEQYDVYKDAQQTYLGQRRTIDARTRLTNFVRELGADTVQAHLDELNQ